MNLIEIIMEYLSQETDKAREMYLSHLVKDCGMDETLVPHIRGLEKSSKRTYVGMFRDSKEDKDVHVYTLALTFPF